jgi:hypothetical protein
MAGTISNRILSDLTRRVDKDGNNRIEKNEGRVKGRVGNDNGIAGVQETADSISDGSAVLYGFQLKQADADAVADALAGGNTWISKDDLNISDAARDQIDGQGGGARDGRISRKEMAAALVRGGLAFNRDGITLSSEVRIVDRPSPPPANDRPAPPSGGSDRPAPPSGSDRPIPPSGGSDRPTPPSGSDRPTPPPGSSTGVPPEPHKPRYFWMPTYPVYQPTARVRLPEIQTAPKPQPGPAPAPARKVDLSEIQLDTYQLLAEKGRLRSRETRLFLFTVHPKLSAGDAKAALAQGKPIYVGPDGGWHGKGSYQEVKTAAALDSYTAEAKSAKLSEMQDAENRAYQQRVDAHQSDYRNRVNSWAESDIRTRENQLLPFNAVYDTDRLALNNFLVSEGGREFNRNLITAMNVYNQPETRREIARKWHENPSISQREFNMLVNATLVQKISNLGWNAQYQGEWGAYLGQNPVPGLRYPDTQEDVDWNANVIRKVASEVPMLLNSAVQR